MTEPSQPETEVTTGQVQVESQVQAESSTEPVPGTSDQPKPKSAARGFFGLVMGGMVAGGIGYGVGQVWPLMQPVSSVDLAALRSEVAELTSVQAATAPRIDDLVARIDALNTAPPADLSQIETRLQGIETALASGLAPSDTAIKALQDDVALLKLSPPGTSSTAALQAEAERILAAARVDAEAISATTRRIAALDRLRAATDSGAPFGASLADLPDPPAILTGMAVTGIPTLTALRDTFPDAARTALAAAIQADMGDSWTDRALSLLQSTTGARSMTPREGNDPDAVLSRSEAALRTGDLDLALTQIAALPPVAQEAMADWSALARSRRDALTAINDLAARIGG